MKSLIKRSAVLLLLLVAFPGFLVGQDDATKSKEEDTAAKKDATKAEADGDVVSQDPNAGIEEGDTVVVIKEKVDLGVRDKPNAILGLGAKIYVTEVRGEWIGGFSIIDAERKTGWVNKNEIVRVILPTEPSARVETKDDPDDEAAVAALEALGLELEKNEQGNVQAIDATDEKFDIKDEHLVHLKGLHHLTTLDLSGKAITDEGAKHLAEVKSLEKLYLAKTQLTNKAAASLNQLPNVESLALADTKVTGTAMEQLKSMVNLRVLNLGKCEIADADLKHFRRMIRLEVLVLSGAKIDGDGMNNFKPLANLRVLNLNDSKVKDASIDNLLGLSELRMLYLRRTSISDDVAKKLKTEMPSLAVYR